MTHAENVKRYQAKNREKMRLKSSRYMQKLTADPDRYEEYLEKRRNYYHSVVKPKREANKVYENKIIKVF
jgi:hypothetical protein